jgi:hypothetical protein
MLVSVAAASDVPPYGRDLTVGSRKKRGERMGATQIVRANTATGDVTGGVSAACALRR